MTNDVQIVKIPVTWSISHNDALMMQMGTKEEQKVKQAALIAKQDKEEQAGCKELAELLRDDYRLLSTILLQVNDRSFLVYTLHHS